MNSDSLAHRVARRHRDALGRRVRASTRVEYSGAGHIDAMAIIRLLEPTLGVLLKLRFRQAIQGLPNTVAFEAVTPHDRRVRGRVVLHAAVAADRITSWGEVLIDSVDGDVPF
jgi:hypothetical protein